MYTDRNILLEDKLREQAKTSITAILNETIKAVTSNRMDHYGSPQTNHERIATLWNGFLSGRAVPAYEDESAPILSPSDVVMMMILVKIARLMNSPDHQDSWKDIAGYGAVGSVVSASEDSLPGDTVSKIAEEIVLAMTEGGGKRDEAL